MADNKIIKDNRPDLFKGLPLGVAAKASNIAFMEQQSQENQKLGNPKFREALEEAHKSARVDISKTD